MILMFLFLQGPVGYVPPPSCEPITTPLCSDLGYTQALIPNFLGHTNQRRAREELNIFSSLVRLGCSRQLKPFICSVYVPECEAAQAEPPCRTLCEQARTGCEPLMNKFGVQWPQSLSCENFTTESCQNVSRPSGDKASGKSKVLLKWRCFWYVYVGPCLLWQCLYIGIINSHNKFNLISK